MIKEEFEKNNIEIITRDIDEHKEEYDVFVDATDNDYVPAIMLLSLDENENANNVELLAPERDFEDIYEAVELVKNYLLD
jgi:hypothetical protein